MQTKLFKGREGWQAETEINLQTISETENRILTISTSKRSGGMITAHAGVSIKKNEGEWISRQFEVFKDFSMTIEKQTVRCTEKNVLAVHNAGLAKLDEVMALVKLQYRI